MRWILAEYAPLFRATDLISIADDREILISRHVNDTAGVRDMINKTGRILTPNRAVDQPHPHFLRWHRENCFKA